MILRYPILTIKNRLQSHPKASLSLSNPFDQQRIMPYLRKSKRTQNDAYFKHVRRKPVEPDGAYHHQALTKTMSGCTATTVTTSITSATNNSSYLSVAAVANQGICPVTGVFANINDDYYIAPDIMGRGHYGIVRECIHRATRHALAVKSISKSKIRRVDHLQNEILLLSEMNHHGIMKMVDCYEDAECVHIITEKYSGGELFDRIVTNTTDSGCLSEHRAVRIVNSLLKAVAYLHANEIVHRDIKPENILFESNHEDAAVKLIDFGLSRRHNDDVPMTNSVGTAYYMSPELLEGKYDKSTDIWSVGVVAYVALCGRPPFNGKSNVEIRNATQRGRLRFRSVYWINKSDDAKDFIECLLRKDPRRRYTVREALAHPWIRENT